MAEIIKIALLGITGVLFAIQFRQQRPEYALLIGFALSILVFSFVCRMAGNLLEEFRGLQQYLGDSKGYLGILMKVVGITYLCEFSAGICKDAGFSSVSDQLEILGEAVGAVCGPADPPVGDPADLQYDVGARRQMDTMWQEYGIEELEKGMQKLFPTFRISVTDLMTQILQGDILGAVGCLLKEVIREMSNSATGIRNILIWLIVLGILSALLIHFVEVFDKHQIADLSFYFIYLLMGVILLQCFSGVLETARETVENIVLFVRLMVPTFLLTVGVASGPVTVGAGYQLMLLLIYGTEKILLGVVLPLIYSYCLLTMINGIWVEEKLALLADLLEKLIGWILKASLGVVTGISLFQSLITPVVDSLKNSAVEKAVSVLPGIGNAADGVLELALGSAVVIRNSVGVLLLLLLVAGCAVPLLQILFTAGFIKCATAFMGIVSDKRITNCTDRMGNAMMLLFRTVGTALLLFMVTLALLAIGSRGI